jgi:hypothetical protein
MVRLLADENRKKKEGKTEKDCDGDRKISVSRMYVRDHQHHVQIAH